MTYGHRYPNPNNRYLLDFGFFGLHLYEPIRIGSEQIVATERIFLRVGAEYIGVNQGF